MLEKLTKARIWIWICAVIYNIVLWALYLALGAGGGKVVLLILSAIMPFLIYGMFRLAYLLLGLFIPFKVMKVFYYIFLGVGTLGSIAMLVNFIAYFPNGYTAAIGVLTAITLATLDRAKKAIKKQKKRSKEENVA